jgi:hypothetical protein
MVHRVVGGVEEDVIELIKGYALKNAVKYNGKASLSIRVQPEAVEVLLS